MRPTSNLARKIDSGDFIITAEYLPLAGVEPAAVEAGARMFQGVTAVNAADNHFGIGLSSLAASVALRGAGVEPVFTLATRDRNRIALQSDLLGASFLGITNVLCLSGYHQALTGNAASANVFDIDSIQLLAMVKGMDSGHLLDGTEIKAPFAMLAGAVANPFLTPLELNILRLGKKIAAGAEFVQTQAVFDVSGFKKWLEAARTAGLTGKAAILAGILPLVSAAEARRLASTFTDFYIPGEVIERLEKAGDTAAQRKEGAAIAAGIIRELKGLPGLRGVHILSGGNEAAVPEMVSAAG
jgi:methylenetetrahydrofolate reductase (NADPH)